MSKTGTSTTYQFLMPIQKRFVQAKQIEASYKPERWLHLFEALAAYDRHNDHVRHRCMVLGGVALGVSFISLFPLGIAEWLETLYWIPVGLFAISVPAFLMVWVLKQKDLPNNLREFILPLLHILREDMDPETELSMHLDLRGGTIRSKRTGEPTRLPSATKYPKIVETPFIDPWFTGSSRLADGSRLQWQITDHIRKLRVTKKSTRGKIKTKWKYKSKRLVEIQLGMPLDMYTPGASEDTPSSPDRLTLRSGPKRHVVKTRRVFKSNDREAVLELQDFIDMIGTAYQQMALANVKEA